MNVTASYGIAPNTLGALNMSGPDSNPPGASNQQYVDVNQDTSIAWAYDQRRVVRAGLLIRVRLTAAPRGATVVPMPIGRGLALLADVADGQCRDGGPELVIRRKHPVVAMAVLPRWRHEIGQAGRETQTA